MAVCMAYPAGVECDVIFVSPATDVGPGVVFPIGINFLDIYPSHKRLSFAKVCVLFVWQLIEVSVGKFLTQLERSKNSISEVKKVTFYTRKLNWHVDTFFVVCEYYLPNETIVW